MAKKTKKSGLRYLRPLDNPRAIQRQWLKILREEIGYLHDISLAIMFEKGILPPLYGGDFVNDHAEVIPLWGETLVGDSDLSLLLLRVMPDVEPNRGLRELREDVDLVNDWPVSQLFDALADVDKAPPLLVSEAFKSLEVALILPGTQVNPAPGYERAEMLDHIGQDLPYAVFIHVPVLIEDEDNFAYDWDDMDNIRAEVVFEETPEALEMAVWHYRLDLALADERETLVAEGVDPVQESDGLDSTANLVAQFELMVMNAVRFYGVTSPVREKQAALDVLRTEDDELLVRAPLKRAVEPASLMADFRADLTGGDDGVILRLKTTEANISQIWSQIRASSYFCMRLQRGKFELNRSGQPRVTGFLATPMIEWLTAESLPELYRGAMLNGLRQLLIATGRLNIRTEFIAEDEESAETDGE